MILAPDHLQRHIYTESILPNLKDGDAPPQRTDCSPNRSVSVSSVNVVRIPPARNPPIAFAYESVNGHAEPVASCSTATITGTPHIHGIYFA